MRIKMTARQGCEWERFRGVFLLSWRGARSPLAALGAGRQVIRQSCFATSDPSLVTKIPHVLQDGVGRSDQKRRSGYTERWWIIFSSWLVIFSGLISAGEGKRLMGVPWDKDTALLWMVSEMIREPYQSKNQPNQTKTPKKSNPQSSRADFFFFFFLIARKEVGN